MSGRFELYKISWSPRGQWDHPSRLFPNSATHWSSKKSASMLLGSSAQPRWAQRGPSRDEVEVDDTPSETHCCAKPEMIAITTFTNAIMRSYMNQRFVCWVYDLISHEMSRTHHSCYHPQALRSEPLGLTTDARHFKPAKVLGTESVVCIFD